MYLDYITELTCIIDRLNDYKLEDKRMDLDKQTEGGRATAQGGKSNMDGSLAHVSILSSLYSRLNLLEHSGQKLPQILCSE